MKKLIAILLALCLVLALAACGESGGAQNPGGNDPSSANNNTPAPGGNTNSGNGGGNTPAAGSGEPIKIGHIVDLTGNEALTGAEASRALQFAVESFGDICGRPVQIVEGDAADSSATAGDLARKMVESDGVAAVFGPTQAGEKASVASYMNEAEVPVLFYSGTPANLFDGNDWLIGAGGANPQMPTMMAKYAYEDLGYRTVNFLTLDNPGFRGFTESFREVFVALGGTVVGEQYAPFGTSDFSTYLATMEDADAIVAWVTGGSAIALWTQWYEMGVSERLPILACLASAFTDYFVCDALTTSAPGAAEAMLGTLAPTMYVYNLDTPENKAFVEAWTAKYGAVPNSSLPGMIYEAYQLFVEAVEATGGDTTPEVLREAILNAKIDGPAGHLEFGDSTAAVKDAYVVKVVELEDGTHNYEIVKEYKNIPPEGVR